MKKGDRIELVYTNDQHTKLKPGDRGTITGFGRTPYETQLWIDWDSGSRLMLLEGVDQFKILTDEEKVQEQKI